MAIASKCKLNTKSIKDKYQALKEVEEGKSKLQVANAAGKSCPCLSLENQNLHDVLRIQSIYNVATAVKTKAGWTTYCLKIGSVK